MNKKWVYLPIIKNHFWLRLPNMHVEVSKEEEDLVIIYIPTSNAKQFVDRLTKQLVDRLTKL